MINNFKKQFKENDYKCIQLYRSKLEELLKCATGIKLQVAEDTISGEVFFYQKNEQNKDFSSNVCYERLSKSLGVKIKEIFKYPGVIENPPYEEKFIIAYKEV